MIILKQDSGKQKQELKVNNKLSSHMVHRQQI